MSDQKTELNLRGYSIVDGQSRETGGATFHGVDPATGARLEPVYHCASLADLNHAADLAEEAFVAYRKLSGRERGRFLRHIADGIEAIVPELVDRANRETALPEARLKGESARTINQLRLFAQVVEEGSWVNARIDPAQPERKPLAALRHSLHDEAARPGRRLRRQQLSSCVFSRRRRHGCRLCCRQSRDRESASRPSGHQRDGRPGHRAQRERVRPAAGRLCAALRRRL